MIIEVLGKPPEHLKETLETMASNIGKEKGVEIKEKKINEPVEMEKQKGFYTSFMEIELEIENIMQLSKLLFKYMPAHLEILSPENLKMSNNSIGELFNELARRLHGYDEIARVIQMEKNILENKLKGLLENKESKIDKTSESKESEPKEDEH